MKLHIVSDLHLEFGDLELPGGQGLIVAGDMCEARSFGRNDSGLSRKIAARLKRFVHDEFGKYEYVVYVPGNHEYYGRTIEETHRLLQLNANPKGHVWIRQCSGFQAYDVNPDYMIYGTTLWTDVGKDSPQGHFVLQKGMADFTTIKDFSTHRMWVLHNEYKLKLLDWIKEHNEYDYKMIVITHHAPSVKSVCMDKYKEDVYMNMGYYSELDSYIEQYPNIKLWIHGHMHDPSDYMIGSTRVVCNPRGYYGYEQRAKDYKPLEIEL